jgi:hypothetical protein
MMLRLVNSGQLEDGTIEGLSVWLRTPSDSCRL